MASFWGTSHTVDEFVETSKGFGPVQFLTAVRLGFDDDRAVPVDSGVPEREQSNFHIGRQTGMRNMKTQMDCAGNFVDILPAGALRPHRGNLNF